MKDTCIPTTQADLTLLANDIYQRLLEKYEADGGSFVDVRDDTGVIFKCVGAVSILLLISNFDDLDNEDQGIEIVLKEFNDALVYVAENGHDATPLVPVKTTRELFSPKAAKQYSYTDTLRWILSLGLQIRFAMRMRQINVDQKLDDDTAAVIKDVLERICESACDGGGWNFIAGCSEPDIYFSYAVVEALGDFADYAQGATPEIFGETTKEAATDHSLLTKLGPKLIASVDTARNQTAEWLVSKYLERLGLEEISPLNSNLAVSVHQHNLLYYTYFVIDMLIICGAETLFADKPVRKHIEHGIYLSRIDYDKALDDPSWLGKRRAGKPLKLVWDDHADPDVPIPPSDQLHDLEEPTLIPLSLRCNILYAYYISQGTDRKINDLFEDLLDYRDEESGLWAQSDYDLMVTEKAIEAIVDYSDYLLKFAKPIEQNGNQITKRTDVDEGFRALVRECIDDYLQPTSAKSFHPANQNDSVTLQNQSLGEREIIKLLSSAFATGNLLLDDKENPDFAFDRKSFEMFCYTFHQFLINSLCLSMQGSKKKYDLKSLRKRASDNVESLLIQLAPFLDSKLNIDAGDMFVFLKDETTNHHSQFGETT